MTGKDAEISGPAIILIDPQLGENIGMVARAMLNCGFTDLRLVRPRDGWPSEKAAKASSGADLVLEKARLFNNTSEAIGNLSLVFAATKRERDMTKNAVTLEKAAKEITDVGEIGCGVLFGGEANGLTNDDVSLANSVLTVSLNPEFSSLNLSQAVLLMAYEIFKIKSGTASTQLAIQTNCQANKKEMLGLFNHLENALDDSGFFHVREKRPIMVRNLRNLIQRADPTEQEVRTLRGVISSLKKGVPCKI
ncbi:MAG: RNA methyltransferase [Rhodospirillales bacterium]|nr:RNA methyltransferase [Rhodospirillales bacterium]